MRTTPRYALISALLKFSTLRPSKSRPSMAGHLSQTEALRD
jgi:hypothetical protein